MRLRLPELLADDGRTPYAVAKASGGRIGLSSLYRLMKRGGHARYLDSDLLDALCDVLGVEPADLLARAPKPKRRPR